MDRENKCDIKEYEASVICTVFDGKYGFEDVLLIGIAHSPVEARSLVFDDILRVMQDFGDGKCEIENGVSEYDEPITIVRTHDKNGSEYTWNYYCLFNENKRKIGKIDNN